MCACVCVLYVYMYVCTCVYVYMKKAKITRSCYIHTHCFDLLGRLIVFWCRCPRWKRVKQCLHIVRIILYSLKGCWELRSHQTTFWEWLIYCDECANQEPKYWHSLDPKQPVGRFCLASLCCFYAFRQAMHSLVYYNSSIPLTQLLLCSLMLIDLDRHWSLRPLPVQEESKIWGMRLWKSLSADSMIAHLENLRNSSGKLVKEMRSTNISSCYINKKKSVSYAIPESARKLK